MSTTPVYAVNSPSVGQEYIAPAAYQVIPNSGSQVKCNVESFDSSGNTVSVTTITAIVRDVTTNTDKASFTYSSGYGANCLTSSPNGSDVYAAAGKVGSSCAQLRMWLTYTGRTADQPPNAPSSLEPDGLETTLTPLMQANFSDPTSGDTLASYEYQVNNASGGGGSQVWDTGAITASSSEKSAAQSSRVYGVGGGTATALTWGGSYSWRARHANQNGAWGPWSSWVNFSTVQGPSAPTITAPTGLQTALGPAFSWGYSSPGAVALASYRFTITDATTGALIHDSGVITHSAASGATVSGTISSGDGQQYGHAYLFNVTATDTNGAASPLASSAFSIAALPQVAPLTPSAGATVNTQTPTLYWSYSDPNYPQAQAMIEVQNAATNTDLLLTAWLAQSAAQYTDATPITYGTQVRWRVQVQDSAGLASGWSAWAYFIVNNAPTATITSPAAGATLATQTPTVVWTYIPSGGGQLQASASVALLDVNGNPVATYALSGAGTSFTIPLGVLVNGQTYHVQVSVTDTVASTGQSASVAFTVSLTPPADLQGQPLANAKNWLLNALLTTDVNQNGIADGWTTFVDTGSVAQFSLDPTISHLVALASGDGPVVGAQKIALSASTTSGKIAAIYQNIPIATPGWTAGTTVLSVVVNAIVSIPGGSTARAAIILRFLNSGGGTISAITGALQADSAGAVVRMLGPQNTLIPALTVTVQVELAADPQASGDTATVWFLDAQLEAAASSDPNVVEGSLGTGFSYDANGYSVRTLLSGGLPSVVANPGADGDPLSALGGTTVVSWDATLADPAFTSYLIERRNIQQQSDDTAWALLATITNPAQASYTDFTPGSGTTYQYSVRQTIVYPGGLVGVSANRAIAVGSVSFSPAWYLSNVAGAFAVGVPLINVRLTIIDTQRTLTWKDNAQYSQFLGRVGSARDAGQPMGYTFSLVCYYDDAWGDNRPAVRRQFVTMQRQGNLWFLKDPEGLVIPVWLQDLQFGELDTGSDTLLTVTLNMLQAQDTTDF